MATAIGVLTFLGVVWILFCDEDVRQVLVVSGDDVTQQLRQGQGAQLGLIATKEIRLHTQTVHCSHIQGSFSCFI